MDMHHVTKRKGFSKGDRDRDDKKEKGKEDPVIMYMSGLELRPDRAIPGAGRRQRLSQL